MPSRDPTPRARFLAACTRKPAAGAPPAWAMRQAGRYLPEYRELRARHGFLELVRTPELAAEVTMQPMRRFPLDAAVVFCDILVPAAAMGLQVDFVEGVGPRIDPPVRTEADVERLRDFDPAGDTGFLASTLRAVRAELGEDRGLIGFAGAPFTTASYLVEGGSSRNLERTKALLHGEPRVFGRLLERLALNLLPYLAMQVEAGADALQVFDSWGRELDAETYARAVLPATRALVEGARALGVPVILYVNGAGHLLEPMLATGADVLSIDHRLAPEEAVRRVAGRAALQGNLDPAVLFAGPEAVRRETRRVLAGFAEQQGYVFNLGSGVLPGTPIEGFEVALATVAESAERSAGRGEVEA